MGAKMGAIVGEYKGIYVWGWRIINPMDGNAKRGECRLRCPSNANLTAVELETTMALVEVVPYVGALLDMGNSGNELCRKRMP